MSDIKNSSPKIYVVHHKPLPAVLDNYLNPIRVSNYEDVPNHVLTDRTGDNIASKNKEYAELTALYWMWKNDTTSTHIGLWHYRRWMLPNPSHYKLDPVRPFISHSYSDEQELEKFKLTHDTLIQACTDYDVILPCFHPFDMSLEQQFADNVSMPLLEVVYRAFDKLYPNFPSLRHFLQSNNKGVFFNMAILRRDLLDNYCNFLFPLLVEAEKDPYLDTHLKGLNPDQVGRLYGLDPRWAGVWGERLFSYYVKNFWLHDPSIRVDHWRMFVFNQA